MSKSRKTKALKIAVPAVAAAAVVAPAVLQAAVESSTVITSYGAEIDTSEAVGLDTYSDKDLTLSCGFFNLIPSSKSYYTTVCRIKHTVNTQTDRPYSISSERKGDTPDDVNEFYESLKAMGASYYGSESGSAETLTDTLSGQSYQTGKSVYAKVKQIKNIVLSGSNNNETLTFYSSSVKQDAPSALWTDTVSDEEGVCLQVSSIEHKGDFDVIFGSYILHYNNSDHKFSVSTSSGTAIGASSAITDLKDIVFSCAKDYIRISDKSGNVFFSQKVEAQSFTSFKYGFSVPGEQSASTFSDPSNSYIGTKYSGNSSSAPTGSVTVSQLAKFDGISRKTVTANEVRYQKAPSLDAVTASASAVTKGTTLKVTIQGADVDSGDTISVMYALDGGAYQTFKKDNATGTQQTWVQDIATGSLQEGNHTLKYKLVDTAGNSSGEKIVSFTVNPATIAVTAVTLDKPTLALEVGGSGTLTANVAPANATDKTITWTSSVPAVATVADGVVTAKSAGTTVITATSGGKSATCTVTVTAPTVNVTAVNISKTSTTLVEGATETISASVAPANATDKAITWTSSAPAVATVDATGKITAVKAGTAVITATSKNGKVASCSVTVTAKAAPEVKVESVALSQSTMALKMGATESGSLTATIAPTNATNQNVTWKSSDESVATVTGGVVKALKAGKVTITVASVSNPAATATCEVTIAAADPVVVPVTGVTLNETTASLKVGGTKTLSATVNPTSATDKTVTWSSSDATVAKVENGKVTALKAGTATITAKCGDKTATCTVTVTADTTPDTPKPTETSAPEITIGKYTTEFSFGEPIKIPMTITDKDEIDEVRIYRVVDNGTFNESAPVGTVSTKIGEKAFFTDEINDLPLGEHTISYIVIDSHGNKTIANDDSSSAKIKVLNISDDDLDNYKDQTKDSVSDRAKSAKEEINKSNASATEKDNAVKEIDKIVSTANGDIDAATSATDVKSIADAAIDKIDKIVKDITSSSNPSGEDSDSLKAAKDSAKDTVDDLVDKANDVVDSADITDTEKSDAKDKIKNTAEKAKADIDNAKSADDIQKIIDDLANQIKDIISDVIKSSGSSPKLPGITIDIPSFPDLPGIDAPDYNDIISKRLQEILDQLNKDLANAKTPEEIKAAIDKAMKAMEELKKYAESVNKTTSDASDYYEKIKDLIDKMSGISDSEKSEINKKMEDIIQKMLDDISKAKTADEVNDIYKEAMEAIKKLYEFAQNKDNAYSSINKYVESIKSIINGMNELSSTQKKEYSDQIDKILEEMLKKLESASSSEEIDKIVADAKERINSILKEAQSESAMSDTKTSANSKISSIADEAKSLIDALKNLTSSEKNKYKSDIEDILNKALKDIANAKSQEEIDKIISDAKAAIDNIVNKAEFENDNISAAPELYISDIESDTFEAGSPIKVTLKVTDGDKDEKVSVYYEIDGKKEQLVEKFTSKGKAVTIEATLPSDLSVGEHEVIFYAVDEEDNYSNKAKDVEIEDVDTYKASKDKANMVTIQIVNTPAEVGIVNIPSSIKEGEDVSVNLSVKDNAGQTIKVYYQVDNAWPVAVGDYTSNGSAVPVNFTIPGLKEGTHVLTFFAEDNLGMKSNANGNVSASTLFGTSYNKAINQTTITVEPANGTNTSDSASGANSAPNVDILTSKTSYDKDEDITINVAVLDKNANQTITSYYSVDNGGANMIKSYISTGKTDAQSFKLSGLTSGTHTVTVWATDDNGAKSDEFNSITITVSNETAANNSTSTTIKPNQSGTIKTGVESETTGSKGVVAAITGGIAAITAAAAGIVAKKRKK